jgi:hypothetical protein
VFPALRQGRWRGLHRVFFFASPLFCVICTSCGAVGYGPPPPVTVNVTPNSAQPFQGEKLQFNATVQNASDPAVNWQVNQTTGGNPMVGMIDSTGLYTAPALVPNPPTVTVIAVLQSDSTKTGSSSVTILALSSIQNITLSPMFSSVTTSQPLQLSVSPGVLSSAGVNWAVDGIPNGNPTVGTFSTTATPGIPPNAIDYIPPPTAGPHTITATANNGPPASATVEVTDFAGTFTWRNDNSRSGVNGKELALAPATVSPSRFGKLFSCTIDGYAYAQPLYVPNLPIPGNGTHNVVIVATEMDSVYAFDADANSDPCIPLWKTSLIPGGSEPVAFPNSNLVGGDIVPFVGITGTPVIDMSKYMLYAVAAAQDIATGSRYSHSLYALDLATGQEQIRPLGAEIATVSGQIPAFSSSFENQRPALLLDNGNVYVAFGSYGGQCLLPPPPGELGPCPYHGWLFGYDSSSLQQTGVFDVTPGTFQGGIWQSGGGPSADSNGNIFAVTGDGPFDVNRGGMSYSNSFLRLGTAGGLTVSDSFTPCNQAMLQTEGLDVGASAPVLLPDSAGSASQPHLLIGGSTGGSLYVVNRDDMGQYVFPCPDSPSRVQTIPLGGAILSTPLFWNNSVYVAPANETLMQFPVSAGILNSSPSASQSPETLGPQGATPVISSNGTNNAILWLIDSSGALTGAPAILRAYDPNNLLNEIYSSPTAPSSPDAAGPAVKFTVPTVANGKVYVGTQTELDVYGLLK